MPMAVAPTFSLRTPTSGRVTPQPAQLRFAAVELVPVAATDALDLVRLGADRAVRILPHRPGRPIGRDHGRGSVLCDPQPAFGEHRVHVGAEQLLQIMT